MFVNASTKSINSLNARVLALLLALLFAFSTVFGVAETVEDADAVISDNGVLSETGEDGAAEEEQAEMPDEEPEQRGPFHLYFIYSDSEKNSLAKKNLNKELAAQRTEFEKACLDISHAMLKSGKANEISISKLIFDSERYTNIAQEEAICTFWEKDIKYNNSKLEFYLKRKIKASDDENAIVIIFMGDEFEGLIDTDVGDISGKTNLYFVGVGYSTSETINSRNFTIEELENELYGDYHEANEYLCIYDKNDVANNRIPDYLEWNDGCVSVNDDAIFKHTIIINKQQSIGLRVDDEPVTLNGNDIARIWACEDENHKTRKQVFDENLDDILRNLNVVADDENKRFLATGLKQIDGINFEFVIRHIIDNNSYETIIPADEFVRVPYFTEETTIETEKNSVTIVAESSDKPDDIDESIPDDITENGAVEDIIGMDIPDEESFNDEDEPEADADNQKENNGDDLQEGGSVIGKTEDGASLEDENTILFCYPKQRGDWYFNINIIDEEKLYSYTYESIESITIENHLPVLKDGVQTAIDFGRYIVLPDTSNIGESLKVTDFFIDIDGDVLFWYVDGNFTESIGYDECFDGEEGTKIHMLRASDSVKGVSKTGVRVSYSVEDVLSIFADEVQIRNSKEGEEIRKGDSIIVEVPLKSTDELIGIANWDDVQEYFGKENIAEIQYDDISVPMTYSTEKGSFACEFGVNTEKTGTFDFEVFIGGHKSSIGGCSYEIVNVPLTVNALANGGKAGSETANIINSCEFLPGNSAAFSLKLSDYITGETNDKLTLDAELAGKVIPVVKYGDEEPETENKGERKLVVYWDGTDEVEIRASDMGFLCDETDIINLKVTDQDESSVTLTVELKLLSFAKKYLYYAIGAVAALILVIVILRIRTKTRKGLLLDVQFTTSSGNTFSGKANATAWHGNKLTMYQLILLTMPTLPVDSEKMAVLRKTTLVSKKGGKSIKVCSLSKDFSKSKAENNSIVININEGYSFILTPGTNKSRTI